MKKKKKKKPLTAKRSFHVLERTRTTVKCTKMKKKKKKARAKRAKYCFSLLNMQIICDFPVAILVVSS